MEERKKERKRFVTKKEKKHALIFYQLVEKFESRRTDFHENNLGIPPADGGNYS